MNGHTNVTKNALSIAAAMAALAGFALEKVELLDVHQGDPEKSILSYQYRTSGLDAARSYKLRTSIRAKAGEPDKRTEKTVVLTNDIASANGTTTATVDLTTVLGPDTYPDCEVLLSIIGGDDWDTFPVGTILDFAGSKFGSSTALPDGFLACDGGAVSRTKYSRLFALIGTTFGEGDKKTTFNLPDFRGTFAEGAGKANEVGTCRAPGVPDFSGQIKTGWGDNSGASIAVTESEGAFSGFDGPKKTGIFGNGDLGVSGNRNRYVKMLASTGEVHGGTYRNDVYGKSETVQPASIVVLKMIKY